MIRIILGIFLLIADLGSLFTKNVSLASDAEAGGYYMAKILIAALALWLIISGIKRKKNA